jgi:hypothetical protein
LTESRPQLLSDRRLNLDDALGRESGGDGRDERAEAGEPCLAGGRAAVRSRPADERDRALRLEATIGGF